MKFKGRQAPSQQQRWIRETLTHHDQAASVWRALSEAAEILNSRSDLTMPQFKLSEMGQMTENRGIQRLTSREGDHVPKLPGTGLLLDKDTE